MAGEDLDEELTSSQREHDGGPGPAVPTRARLVTIMAGNHHRVPIAHSRGCPYLSLSSSLGDHVNRLVWSVASGQSDRIEKVVHVGAQPRGQATCRPH